MTSVRSPLLGTAHIVATGYNHRKIVRLLKPFNYHLSTSFRGGIRVCWVEGRLVLEKLLVIPRLGFTVNLVRTDVEDAFDSVVLVQGVRSRWLKRLQVVLPWQRRATRVCQ